MNDLIPTIPDDEQKDKDLQQAQAILDFIALNEEDGFTVNEIVKQLKGVTRNTEFIYLLILGKHHLLEPDVYPFPSFMEGGTVLRVKLVKNPKFRTLPESVEDLLKDPSCSFIYDPKPRLELSILAHCMRYITDTGFSGSLRYMSKNYALQELLIPFQYRELWDCRPRADLCTAVKLYEEEEFIPNIMIEQISRADGRKRFKAILAASSQSTISEKIKLMDSLDKTDGVTEGNTTNIQNNITITDTDLANRFLKQIQTGAK